MHHHAIALVIPACIALGQGPVDRAFPIRADADGDGLPNPLDNCPSVDFAPSFDVGLCGPMDLDPNNDALPECRARERVARVIYTGGVYLGHISFAVVKDGEIRVADSFEYLGQGNYARDPDGVHRLFRIGSTSKSVVAVTAKLMEEQFELSLDDWVNDEDGTGIETDGQRTLRNLLSHRGAFRIDSGVHLFCYPGDLAAFWAEPDDSISPRFDTQPHGNLGGGYSYSAFNYGLAGAYLAHRSGTSFEETIQTRVFDQFTMCTATLDGARAVSTTIGAVPGISQAAVMHIGPYINMFSPKDPLCVDNFYSTEDLPQDSYTWQPYFLDEASAEARDPAGGVIASAVDMAHFARELLDSYHNRGGPVSPQGIRDLWAATSDLGCGSNCFYEPFYGLGFFTNSVTGENITQVGHGGSRAGFASAFVIRPEADMAVCILANADVSTVTLSDLAKQILDDFDE